MFFIIALNVGCVFLMALPGVWASRKGMVSKALPADLSYLTVKFIYPCLIFSSIFRNYSTRQLLGSWQLPAAAFLIMLIGSVFALLSSPAMRFASGEERKAFHFQCVMNNYSFLPLPLVGALFGTKGEAALLLSSFGAELALWTLGVLSLTGGRFDFRNLRHLFSPPLVAIYLAIVCRGLCDLSGYSQTLFAEGAHGPLNYLLNAIRTFGLACVPLAMVIAGCRIGTLHPKGFNNPRVWVLTFARLVAIPLLAIYVLRHWLPISGDELKVMTVVAVMPVALASFMFSELYGGDKQFITCTVVSTHVAALATVPILLTLLLR